MTFVLQEFIKRPPRKAFLSRGTKNALRLHNREQTKIRKNVKFPPGLNGVKFQSIEPPERHHDVKNASKAYENMPHHQELLKRLQKAKSALKVNDILAL